VNRPPAARAGASAVIVLDSRLGAVLPASAVPVLRTAEAVYATDGLLPEVADPAPEPGELLRRAESGPLVLITADPADPAALALTEAGALLLAPTAPAGAELLAAVAVMDRLRSPGGCPWDAEQTHDSLRQYLIEETYELLDAIEESDRAALREELGDVLLQVLFHARIAEESAEDTFGIDEVAEDLAGKLIGRHPHVFAGGDPAVSDSASQILRWEELKQAEKRRESSVDGVALGAPALALAGKLVSRTIKKGLPADLWPSTEGTGDELDAGRALFALAAQAIADGHEPEGALRAVAKRFATQVRAAEAAAKAAGLDPAELDAQAWRKFWH
jgi:XTP/dITP diphosphohydrolase